MTLEQILKEWEKDAVIDKTKLNSESLNSDNLHCKYLRELSNANMMREKKRTEYNKVVCDRFIYYTEGVKTMPTKEDMKKMPRGAILKSEADRYVQADEDVIAITLELALAQEKCNTLKSILDTIARRSYIIGNANTFNKFMAGEK